MLESSKQQQKASEFNSRNDGHKSCACYTHNKTCQTLRNDNHESDSGLSRIVAEQPFSMYSILLGRQTIVETWPFLSCYGGKRFSIQCGILHLNKLDENSKMITNRNIINFCLNSYKIRLDALLELSKT